ncbi:MAG: histidinol-phosphate transaminase [Pseudomonadota bacterium]
MTPLAHIAALAPYGAAELGPELTSLAQNESAFPPSPRALEAARMALAEARLYPDPNWTLLRRAIAETHPLGPGEILCGAGSMELIGALATAYLGPGRRALIPAHAYPYFATAVAQTGAALDRAPEDRFTADPDALLAAVRSETTVLFLANPGNPTGTHLPPEAIRALRAALPSHVLLVLDEAYGEFADPSEGACWDLVARGDTVVLRTLSKAYALASLRAGWGLFPPEIASLLRRVLRPNTLSAPTQAAAAAALRDRAHRDRIVAETAARRESFGARLAKAGFTLPGSATNFVLVPFASAADAQSADRAIRAGGIAPRSAAGAGLPHALRITIGPEAAMDHAADILTTHGGAL